MQIGVFPCARRAQIKSSAPKLNGRPFRHLDCVHFLGFHTSHSHCRPPPNQNGHSHESQGHRICKSLSGATNWQELLKPGPISATVSSNKTRFKSFVWAEIRTIVYFKFTLLRFILASTNLPVGGTGVQQREGAATQYWPLPLILFATKYLT